MNQLTSYHFKHFSIPITNCIVFQYGYIIIRIFFIVDYIKVIHHETGSNYNYNKLTEQD
jgi:hypothetical protein